MAKKVIAINKEKEGKAYMQHRKEICRKIKCCWIPFSLEESIWI
jgi:hypothetical protein